ncbi:hypothetical protein [uncultured Litoreibacter sp.]|uniref:hypothetical protein n=1 Tax=uncultured Litoreibacter sp. TaxID=1392394 RepID=UPI00261DC695|nr:hypothetical protein [uncultured Litoreibacter sp.]
MLRVLQQFILTTLFAVFASQASAMFIQADWFDPTEPGVGTNRYAYSGNDPINQYDPFGNNFSNAPGDYDFSPEQAAAEEAEMEVRGMHSLTGGGIINTEIGHLNSGPGRRSGEQAYIDAVNRGKIGPNVDTGMSRAEINQAIRDLTEQKEQSAMMCESACGDMVYNGTNTAIGSATATVGAVTSTMNDVPTRAKPKGSTPGTSVASLAARQTFGNRRLPGGVRLPAPTRNAPMTTSNRIAPVVGRTAGPVVGVLGVAIGTTSILSQDSQFRGCVASCGQVDFLNQ